MKSKKWQTMKVKNGTMVYAMMSIDVWCICHSTSGFCIADERTVAPTEKEAWKRFFSLWRESERYIPKGRKKSGQWYAQPMVAIHKQKGK